MNQTGRDSQRDDEIETGCGKEPRLALGAAVAAVKIYGEKTRAPLNAQTGDGWANPQSADAGR
jgi:hypothetical protein